MQCWLVFSHCYARWITCDSCFCVVCHCQFCVKCWVVIVCTSLLKSVVSQLNTATVGELHCWITGNPWLRPKSEVIFLLCTPFLAESKLWTESLAETKLWTRLRTRSKVNLNKNGLVQCKARNAFRWENFLNPLRLVIAELKLASVFAQSKLLWLQSASGLRQTKKFACSRDTTWTQLWELTTLPTLRLPRPLP